MLMLVVRGVYNISRQLLKSEHFDGLPTGEEKKRKTLVSAWHLFSSSRDFRDNNTRR